MGLSLCAAARQEDHKTTEEVFGKLSTVKDISQNEVKACFGTNCTTYRKIESPNIRKKIKRQKRKLENLQQQLKATRAKKSRNKISYEK
jgi:Ser-tRNA(Ala) deacylase AlaX